MRGIPAEQKIKEIEEGTVKNETKIIENNPEEIIKRIVETTAESNKLDTCLPSGGMLIP